MKIDVFHIGPAKTATTWAYRCMDEHPQIAVPKSDAIHYFDMHYARGEAWLEAQYSQQEKQCVVDPTPSYFNSLVAAERMHVHNPDAKLICCLRHPIERAFSHYWHEKKKGAYTYGFSDVLDNPDLFHNCIETGFYARHLEHWLALFPREQILVQWYDDLKKSPETFLKELFEFMGVDTDFTPSIAHQRVNEARSQRYAQTASARSKVANMLDACHLGWIKPTLGKIAHPLLGKSAPEETLAHVAPETIRDLQAVFKPEIERLEALLNVRLDHWKESA